MFVHLNIIHVSHFQKAANAGPEHVGADSDGQVIEVVVGSNWPQQQGRTRQSVSDFLDTQLPFIFEILLA